MESLTLISSNQAATHLSREKFAAIFLDVHMPSPNGIALTQQIRASGLNRTTPIAIITAEGDTVLCSGEHSKPAPVSSYSNLLIATAYSA